MERNLIRCAHQSKPEFLPCILEIAYNWQQKTLENTNCSTHEKHPKWRVPRHGVRKVTKDLRSGMSQGRKMGERVPIFPKNECYQYRLIHKNVKSIAGSRGSAPWWGLGHGVRKVTKDLRSGMSQGRKMGERVPIFPKNECYQYPAHS